MVTDPQAGAGVLFPREPCAGPSTRPADIAVGVGRGGTVTLDLGGKTDHRCRRFNWLG